MTAGLLWADGLPLVLIAPAVGLALWLLDRRNARAFAAVAGPRAEALADASRGRRRARRVLGGTALLLALLALLQPAWGAGVVRVERRGIDVVLCLDVSRSMLARDVRPSRLARAQQELRALAERASGDRLALVAFAGDARLVVPLTRDGASFAELASLADPLTVPRGGTDLRTALTTALAALGDAREDPAAIVLITDGEDHGGGGREAAAECARRGVVVHCAGFGSARGSKIALPGERGEEFLRADGSEVVSALDEAGLRAIADAGGGAFVDAGRSVAPLRELYEAHVRPLARRAFHSEESHTRENRFQWPLLAALLLWLLELGTGERRRR